MAPDRLETGAWCCFNKFNCRLFISKFSQFALYLSLSLSVVSKSLAQLCCKSGNHSVSVVLNVRFVTNGLYVKINTHIYASQTSRNRMSTTWDLYCCLLPQCEALHTCRLGFPITTKWCFDQDVKVVPGAIFTKRMCDRCGYLQKGGDVVATSQLMLRWKCDSPQIGCVQRATHKYMWREQAIIEWSLLLLAATVWSFAHLPFKLFDNNTRNIYFLVFCMPNTWKWSEMNMYLDLNLAIFQYIDGFGCYHFCLNRFGLEMIFFFWTLSQLSVQFWDFRLLQDRPKPMWRREYGTYNVEFVAAIEAWTWSNL